MSKKKRQANFEQALQALRASGFETAQHAPEDGIPEGGVLVSRAGYGAVLAPGEERPQVVVGAGRLVAGHLARLVDRGYQKFMKTSQYEFPATARDLHAVHLFSEELRQLTGATSLFNESLGTTSDRYLYDRVKGRAAAVAVGARPWDQAASH
jgi:hypothetical protein